MQYDKRYEGVEAYKAITLSSEDGDAISQGKKHELLLDNDSPYRGEVLIVTLPLPQGERSGMIVGKATIESIEPQGERFLWRFKDARRMIEFPAQQCDMEGFVWDLFYTQDTLMEYPSINLRPFLLKRKRK